MQEKKGLSAAEKLERKMDLAKERDTRVVITRTADTHLILDVVRSLDKGVNALRKGMVNRYDAELVVALVNKAYEATKALNDVTAEICKVTGVPYQAPKGLLKK